MTRFVPILALLYGCGRVETPLERCEDGDLCAIMGTGELGFNQDGGALETRLASPTSVGVDPDGRVVVVDYSNMLLRTLTPQGRVETIAGNGIHAYSEPGAHLLDSPLENPVDVAWSPDGQLMYILPQHEGRVIMAGPEQTIALCAGTGVLADSGDGGNALDAEMGFGAGLAVASDGTLFISDNTYSRIRRVGVDGTIDTILGIGSGGQDEPGYGPDTAIWSPERIAVDEAGGRLIVADAFNHRVLAVDLDTLDTSLVAGTGESGYTGDGGPAHEAALHSPIGVAVSPSGTVLIGDLDNHVIRAVWPDGTIDTVAGYPDGGDPILAAPPLEFPMQRPAGMAWTPEGSLLIAERSGHRVLMWRGAADAL